MQHRQAYASLSVCLCQAACTILGARHKSFLHIASPAHSHLSRWILAPRPASNPLRCACGSKQKCYRNDEERQPCKARKKESQKARNPELHAMRQRQALQLFLAFEPCEKLTYSSPSVAVGQGRLESWRQEPWLLLKDPRSERKPL